MKHILQQITALSDVPDNAVLKRLIDELRVNDKEPALANANIQSLIDILRQHPEYADGLSSFVLKIIIQYRQIALYTDTGIMSDQGFFNSLRRLVGHRPGWKKQRGFHPEKIRQTRLQLINRRVLLVHVIAHFRLKHELQHLVRWLGHSVTH